MSKLAELDRNYWPQGGYGHWCPGCQAGHEINVDQPNASGAKWAFDGDAVRPTFTPSVNLRVNPKGHPHYQPDVTSSVCHYFIRAGMIQFLGDSTHALAGQTVEMPDLPSHVYRTCQRL